MQSFFGLMQMVVMPMIFLSGAMFPLTNLPSWLHVLTTINPLTYAVDPMRQAVFSHLNVPDAVNAVLNPGITWGTWHLPVSFELGLITVLGLALLSIAVVQFKKAD